LIIHEKAKQVKPQSKLATKLDLEVDPDIKDALQEKIFSSAEVKRMIRFQSKKITFENVTPKPGVTYLVGKTDLEDAIDLLNSLLPSIII
jgi:hypothetical protein